MPRHSLQKKTGKTTSKKTRKLIIKKQNTVKNKKQNTIKNRNGHGGGLMNLVIHEEKDKSNKLPFGLDKLDPSSYFKNTKANPNMYRVIYNYGSPYQTDITLKQNQIIPSSQVINKPHLFMPEIGRAHV